MKEKRAVGSVYCITDIDKFGKCKNGFEVPLNLKINKEQTLGNKIDELEKKILTLGKKLDVLTKLFKTIIKSIGGLENEMD